MIARILGRLRYVWDRRAVEVGPLLITTHKRVTEREWNAFEIGRDFGACHGSVPRDGSRERHLRVVS